jgi:DNA-binding response OmpR family regulator
MVQTSAPPLVLVADDEPTMLELVARHLESIEDPKLQIIQASDGEEAWRLAREHLPDLVVLDVMMPGMSGWEVCRKIREDVSLAHTAVVMLTGIGENLNQMTSPLYGADAHVDKPFEFEDLDSKVKEALAARAPQRDAVARPVRTNGVTAPAKAASAKGKGKPKAKASAKSKAKKTPSKKKSTHSSRSGSSGKGKAKTMAAKKSAKKGAKKSAKKGAKKAAKKKK